MTVYSAASASGFWSLKELAKAVSSGGFPITYDPYFNSTVLLLNADDASDAGQNNTFLDSSTNAHTITRNGNVTQGSFSPFSQDEGKWGNYFDGSDTFTLSNASEQFVPETQDFTYETWFYTSDNTRQDIYSSYTSSTGFGVALSYSNFGDVLVYKGNTLVLLTTGGHFNLNQWHHVAVSRSSTSLKVFIDGRLVLEQWTANDGSNRSKHKLNVNEFKFLDSKGDNQQPQQRTQQQYASPAQQPTQQQYNRNDHQSSVPEVNIDDEEIPF